MNGLRIAALNLASGTPSSVLVQANGGAADTATELNFVNGDNTTVTATVGAGVATIQVDASAIANLPAVNVTGTTQVMVTNHAYMANNAALVTLTLPTTAAFGDTLIVTGLGAGGWKIAQNAGQSIQFGAVGTTIGVTGSLSSTNRYDSITLFCAVANTTWVATASQGNLTVV